MKDRGWKLLLLQEEMLDFILSFETEIVSSISCSLFSSKMYEPKYKTAINLLANRDGC